MNTAKEEESVKRSPLGILQSLIAKLLERAGLRCGACSLWCSSRVSVANELNWGTDMGGVFFADPFYIEETSRFCTRCNHLMDRKRKISNKQVE